MEGNLQKDNPKNIPVSALKPSVDIGAETGNQLQKNSAPKATVFSDSSKQQTPTKPIVNQKEKVGVFVSEEAKGDFYEIRTMQHDIDTTKGKQVSSVNITRESLLKQNEQKPLGERTSLTGKMDAMGPKGVFYSSKEGSIGQADAILKQNLSSSSFLVKLRDIFSRKNSRPRMPGNKRFGLVLTLIILIFIGGIGYYFYNSGALSFLGGIGEMFQSWFSPNRQSTSTPPIPPISSTTPPIPPINSTTTPPADDEFKISAAFFEPDDTEIIKLETLSDFYSEIEKSFAKTLSENKFRRIVVGAKNSLATLSLAELWKNVKELALGNKYSELISGEAIDNWGLAMPGNIYRTLANEYNIFFYGQPQDASRIALILKVNDTQNLAANLNLWETTMLFDLKKLFLGTEHGNPFSETFLDNVYKNFNVRYLNLPGTNLTLDYAFMPDKNYLILTTSRESMWAAIDRILDSKASDAENNLDISTWKTYTNQEYGFEIKYPSNYIVNQTFAGDGIQVIGWNMGKIDNNEKTIWIQMIYATDALDSAKIFKDLAEKTMLSYCTADGVRGSVDCDKVVQSTSFLNKNSVKIYEIYLNEIYTTYTKIGVDTGEITTGPFFAIEFSQKIGFSRGIYFDVSSSSIDSDKDLTRNMVSTFKFINQ